MPAVRARWIAGLALVGLMMPAVPGAVARSRSLRFGPATRIDAATQYLAPRTLGVSGLSCPTAQLCVGVGDPGQVETSVHPDSPSSWNSREISPHAALDGTPARPRRCAWRIPSEVTCSPRPTRAAVRAVKRPGVITGGGVYGGVSCPTVALCVAVTGGGTIAVSTNPQAGVWRLTKLGGSLQLDSVSCPSASLCVIADYDGHVVTSTNPTGGASAWKLTDLSHNRPTDGAPRTVSCGSVTECVIGDNAGDLIASSAPTGGANAWSVQPVDQGSSDLFVSCLPSRQCVAADDGGHVLQVARSGRGAPWRTSYVDPSGIFALPVSRPRCAWPARAPPA